MTDDGDRRTHARADAVRQATVALSAVLAVVGAAIGSGAFVGTPVAEVTGGALAAAATLASAVLLRLRSAPPTRAAGQPLT